ncbi:hypothetical protein EDD11_008458 [Mortierella claussenii]|nr:hypothetical protein EDD11_008458 [Mortierella claussenii]
MPSTRFETRNQAKAIPLVTVSLASGSLRQTCLANNIIPETADSQGKQHSPSTCDALDSGNYDSSNTGDNEIATASPSNQDITEAVLHLSRSLISTKIPQPASTSSWLFMMIYSWTHTQRTTSRLYHILTKPSTLLKDMREQDGWAAVHQQKKQRVKSIQQMTEEQDRMEDISDVTCGATELVPVSMINTRSVATMEESLPEDPQDLELRTCESSDEDSTTPRRPRRRIDKYPNPFGTGVSSSDEMEDDEGWFGRGEDRSEDGHRRTNSVRLASPRMAPRYSRRMPDFGTPSLGPAMDPRQFESGEDTRTGSLVSSLSTPSPFDTSRAATFNNPSPSISRISHSTGSGAHISSSSSTISSAASFHTVEQFLPSHDTQFDSWKPHDRSAAVKDNDRDSYARSNYVRHSSSFVELPWSEPRTQPSAFDTQSVSSMPDVIMSTSAAFTEIAPTIITVSSSGHSIAPLTGTRSLEQAIS